MRAFVAVELPAALQAEIHAFGQTLAAAPDAAQLARQLRWTPAANLHLTLRFLGETTAAQHDALAAQLRALAATTRPFDLTLGGIGCFPNWRRASVLWLGLQEDAGSATLARMQRDVEALCVAAGFAPETRPFAPHLTLARVARGCSAGDAARIGEAMQRAAALPAMRAWRRTVRVDHVAFMQSDLQPHGPIYTALDRAAFASG